MKTKEKLINSILKIIKQKERLRKKCPQNKKTLNMLTIPELKDIDFDEKLDLYYLKEALGE